MVELSNLFDQVSSFFFELFVLTLIGSEFSQKVDQFILVFDQQTFNFIGFLGVSNEDFEHVKSFKCTQKLAKSVKFTKNEVSGSDFKKKEYKLFFSSFLAHF